MGNKFQRILAAFGGNQQRRILLLGLDSAGKTTIVYRVKDNETVQTIPTIGFNCEEIVMPKSGINFVVWDVGGQEKLISLWKHYFNNASGLFFVIDSSDRSRFETARIELHRVLDDEEMRGVPVVVLANKQDISGAAKSGEISEALGLNGCDRKWYVQESQAINGVGLLDAFEKMAIFSKEFAAESKRKKL